MSFIKLRCVCGQKLKIPGKFAGSQVKCPKCNASIDVAPNAPPASPATPPPIPTNHVSDVNPQAAPVTTDVVPPIPGDCEQGLGFEESEQMPSAPAATGSLLGWLTLPEQPGYEPEFNERSGVHWLATVLFLLALFSMGPALWRVVNCYRFHLEVNPPQIVCWTYLMLIAGIVQLAYAVYLYQLPDWSTVWVISLVMLVLTTIYAVVLVIRLLAGDGNLVLVMLQLHYETANQLASVSQQAGWCFCMLLVNGTFTFFAGRFGLRWKQQYKQAFSTETPSS